MKKVAAVVLLFSFASSSALAGVIGFDPSKTEIDPAVDSPVFTVDLLVDSSTLGSFNAVDVMVGSNDGLMLTGFALDTPGVTRFFESSAMDNSVYSSGWKFGYFGTPTSAPQLLGTLTVDTTGLAFGTYNLVIDSSQDGGASKLTSGSNVDLLTGSASVNIIPEPATISLLALAALGLVRRRRTA